MGRFFMIRSAIYSDVLRLRELRVRVRGTVRITVRVRELRVWVWNFLQDGIIRTSSADR